MIDKFDFLPAARSDVIKAQSSYIVDVRRHKNTVQPKENIKLLVHLKNLLVTDSPNIGNASDMHT